MKQLLVLIAIAVACMRLSACSSSDPVTPQPGDTTKTDTTKHDTTKTDTTKHDTTKVDTVKLDTSSIARSHDRLYNSAKGGAQIIAIYYDQNGNTSVFGKNNEWIIIQTDRNLSTRGWWLNAGDPLQDYTLPDTIFKYLTIYTHDRPGVPSRTTMSLGLPLSTWIWNNSDPDTAWLYNEKHEIVDSLTYK